MTRSESVPVRCSTTAPPKFDVMDEEVVAPIQTPTPRPAQPKLHVAPWASLERYSHRPSPRSASRPGLVRSVRYRNSTGMSPAAMAMAQDAAAKARFSWMKPEQLAMARVGAAKAAAAARAKTVSRSHPSPAPTTPLAMPNNKPCRNATTGTKPRALHSDRVCVAIPCAPQHWGALLKRSLRSVALQTHKHIVRTVVVLSLRVLPWQREQESNTQTTCDTNQKVLEEWTRSTPQLGEAKLVCNTRGGYTRGENRNLGATACNGIEWIAFIDADDEMIPHRISRMLELLHAHNAVLGLHAYMSMNAKDPHVSSCQTVNWLRGGIISSPERISLIERQYEGTDQMFMARIGTTHHGHCMVKRSVFAWLRQNEGMRVGEDVDFVKRVVHGGYRTVHTTEELTVYRMGSSVHSPASYHRPSLWHRAFGTSHYNLPARGPHDPHTQVVSSLARWVGRALGSS